MKLHLANTTGLNMFTAYGDDYVAVNSSPHPPPVEFVPPRPEKGALWVDGSWEWTGGGRFGWRSGTWAMIPKGLLRARWVVVRRKVDGQLFFAPSTCSG